MSTTNPFSAPATAANGAAVSPTADAFAEGDLLYTDRHAVLPAVCAKCGSHDDVEHVRLKAQWAPIWVRLSILASPLIMLILWFIFKKDCDIQVGLCPTHRSQRNLGRMVGFGGLIAGAVGIFGGMFTIEFLDELALLGILGGFVLLLVGVVVLAVMAMPLRLKKVTDEHAIFKGAHPALLDAVGRG